ncbi:MAG: DNA primase [Hyphomicrobiaceae bacterium]
MRYPPDLLDEIRARLSVSHVVGRKVALKKKGREWAGLSPFKVEKTPSFFVNDQKGFYHCFASGEHGDIFKFLMVTEGLSFPEAVERLAEEAGVQLPKPSDANVAREGERHRLLRIMDVAQAFFRRSLDSSEGREARAYLARRGLRQETIAAFGIGYAPAARGALKAVLAAEGFSAADMALSGMLIAGDDIPVSYDRFRNRVTFPIRDTKGRIIAFGGRALDPSQPAKYLNSPETPLFHKGHVLFNATAARETAHATGEMVVVEGYMDVVALAEAGFTNAVAPLGTALTEEQVQLLWRFVPEPTLCFDGDAAGRKAAFRAVDTILPLLRPGQSVRFAFLPDGLDPDDLIRQQGGEAMAAVLARTRPLADMLWEREWAQGDWSTPERRARLEQSLNSQVARIGDTTVKAQYAQLIRQRLYQAWREAGAASGRPARGHGMRGKPPHPGRRSQQVGIAPGAPRGFEFSRPAASSSLRQSALVAGSGILPPHREALLLKALVNHPWLIEDAAERIARLTFTAPALGRLRDALLSLVSGENVLDRATLRTQLELLGLLSTVDVIERVVTHKGDRFAEPETDSGEVVIGWRHTLALHEIQGLQQELAEAEREFSATGSAAAQARLLEIAARLNSAASVGETAETEGI